MNPESQKLAIAKACGWTLKGVERSLGIGCPFPVWLKDGRRHDWLPRYAEDLNAMHEAEDMLKGAHEMRYVSMLRLVIEGQHGQLDAFGLVHATAAQRAEAFLKTLSLWQDDEKPTTAQESDIPK